MARSPASNAPGLWRILRGGLILAALVALHLAGCGKAKFGSVSGRVTLDNQPLAHTTVEFQPAAGSPSYGVTDDRGYYTLQWSPEQSGAQVGEHTVRITSFDEGNRRQPERVPPRYNRQTDLRREVKPGHQQFDFDLTSK